jgi:hypothetical protein
MATFPRFNGDAQPVFALDVNNGSQTGNIGSTDALVQMQGPKLDFFKVLVNGDQGGGNAAVDLRDELGGYSAGVFDPGLVQQINQAIQRTSTIAIYQVEGATTGQISYAIYPAGAYDAASLQVVIRALGNVQITSSNGTVTGVQINNSTVTQPGFQLA